MGEKGFERIDDILSYLTQEMEESFAKKAKNEQHRLNEMGLAHPTDPETVVDGNRWLRDKKMGGLFTRMNTKFENIAKQFDGPKHPMP